MILKYYLKYYKYDKGMISMSVNTDTANLCFQDIDTASLCLQNIDTSNLCFQDEDSSDLCM